ncbi:MAG: hypothetical protein C5B50_05705 [Verrucomicrobia bacterium]|nr:MAG: hypothetical protein C5B50_05705 [Verrucomicrobiota bacterium]
MLNAQAVKDWLKLAPNPAEGGLLRSVYLSSLTVPNKVLPGFPPAKRARAICGAIYYFLEHPDCSVMHRVTGDMLYHFYTGDPVQMLLLYPVGSPVRAEVCVLGNNLAQKQNPMKAIPGGTWLGSRLMSGGSWALMGVSMAPGFDAIDYTIGDRNQLMTQYPEQADLIEQLTRKS